MLILSLGILLFAAAALLIIWLPFFRQNKRPVDINYRQKTNSDIYQYQLSVAAKLFKPDEPEFPQLKNELALGLLTEERELVDREPVRKPSLFMPVLMSLIVIGLPAIGYSLSGNYSQATQYSQPGEQNPLAGLTGQEAVDVRLSKLFDKIKADPRDDEAWFILTEYYLYNNHFDNALIALNKVKSIRGETNEVLAAEAMVLYYQNSQRINPQIQGLIDRVLQSDPLQLTVLMLMASDFYYHAQYQEAIDIWQRLLDSNNPQIDRIMLIERINVAKMMLNRQ